MKVYIVESGEYSDRCIEKIYTKEEKAKKLCELNNNLGMGSLGDYYYTEYDVDNDNNDYNFISYEAAIWLNDNHCYVDLCFGNQVNHNALVKSWNGNLGLNCYGKFNYDPNKSSADDYETYKNRAKKCAYDLLAKVKHMLAEGATIEMINEAIN